MCGIAGIVRYDQAGSASRPCVSRMLDCLRHRGPDDQNIHIGSFAALANARLSLVDFQFGAQPMQSRDHRFTITYNGEIYNFRELRAELEPYVCFHSESDTEVVLAACSTWGVQALARFNGMFAFFIWDEEKKTGFGARDRLGIKPLAYTWRGGKFAFASEAKALVAIDQAAPSANIESILEYLVAPYFSGVERGMFDGVEYLQPGHCFTIDRDGLRIDPWWDYTLPESFQTDADHLSSILRERLERAVVRTLQADSTVGLLLSGGLDSTLIGALAAKHAGTRVDAYTIHFQQQEQFDYARSLIVNTDDTPYAVAAAETIGFRHTLVDVPRRQLAEDLRLLAQTNDAIPAWEQELAQHHLARAASREHRAVLVGDAADETHYGYSFLLDDQVTQSPAHMTHRFGLPPINKNLCSSPVKYFNDKYQAFTDRVGYVWDTRLNRLRAATYLIVKRWLPRLLHNGDVHSMAFSLESRVPFGDIELLQLAQVVHPELAISEGIEKRLLRQAAHGWLPEKNRLRRKSALPKDQQTSTTYKQEARRALKESDAFLATWLDLEAIEPLLHDNRNLHENERGLLFRIIALHHWRHAYNVRIP